MIRGIRSSGITFALLLLCQTGCELFDTKDLEETEGADKQVFRPYTGGTGEAVRLSLQMFHGCAILANGMPVKRGAVNVPYPETCLDARAPAGLINVIPPAPPQAVFRVVTGTSYFLNQLTLMEQATGAHTDWKSQAAATEWIKTSTVFSALDWSGVGVEDESWTHRGPDVWRREVRLGQAAWMVRTDNEYVVELIDQDGATRGAPVVYTEEDFLSSSARAGHSRFSWTADVVGPPTSWTDAGPTPVIPGVPAEEQPYNYQTVARYELYGSTNPFKTLRVDPELVGDGAIKVTWNQLPDQPFYFPVTFVKPTELPATCYAPPDYTQKVPCAFGLEPSFAIQTPPNGKGYYEPGEIVELRAEIRDSAGNLLHPPELLPSYASFWLNLEEGNGLGGFLDAHELTLRESDLTNQYAVAGPIQDIHKLTRSDRDGTFLFPEGGFGEPLIPLVFQPGPEMISNPTGVAPGVFESPWSSRFRVQLPENAKSGTYIAQLKMHRQFYGERISRLSVTEFQVGSPEPTKYPSRVGNCQICHRGVLTLENVRHGMSGDHVESCSTCHVDGERGRNFRELVHQLHMESPKYAQDKRDCTVCHLTKESALLPTIGVCSTCHPTAHGDKYFNLAFTTTGEPSRYTNCAQSCHVVSAPQQHILPAN